MVKIIPGPLTNDIEELKQFLFQSENVVDQFHIDIVDGVFAQNKTIFPEALENIETNLKLDFHLMVKDPIGWVTKCVNVGGERIIGHIEKMENQLDFVNKIHELGKSAGLAIDLVTPIEHLDTQALPLVDVVLVMSVPAGFGGQQFNLSVFDKLKKLSEIRKRENLNFTIVVDGGVTKELVNDLEKLEVNEVVIGKRIFEGSLKENLDNLNI